MASLTDSSRDSPPCCVADGGGWLPAAGVRGLEQPATMRSSRQAANHPTRQGEVGVCLLLISRTTPEVASPGATCASPDYRALMPTPSTSTHGRYWLPTHSRCLLM